MGRSTWCGSADWLWNLELQWEQPIVARFLERLASFSRLLLFDKRGRRALGPDGRPRPLHPRGPDRRCPGRDGRRSLRAGVRARGRRRRGVDRGRVRGDRPRTDPRPAAVRVPRERNRVRRLPVRVRPERLRRLGQRDGDLLGSDATVAGGSGASRHPSRTTRTSSGGTRGCFGRPRVRGPSPRSNGRPSRSISAGCFRRSTFRPSCSTGPATRTSLSRQGATWPSGSPVPGSWSSPAAMPSRGRTIRTRCWTRSRPS